MCRSFNIGCVDQMYQSFLLGCVFSFFLFVSVSTIVFGLVTLDFGLFLASVSSHMIVELSFGYWD